jgi:hypothetical protein
VTGRSDDEIDIERLIAQELVGFNPAHRAGSSAPIGAVVVNWRNLPDEDAAQTWAKLRDWIEWVTVRYNIPLSLIPNCWYQHAALVEELSALHTAHTAAFDESDAGYGPISWHERFAAALPRLAKAYGGGCTRGHDPLTPRSWDDVITEQEWDRWVTTTHAHRGDPASHERKKE